MSEVQIPNQDNLLIGPSTGWLSSKISPDIKVHSKILEDTGSSAYEMFWTPDRHPFMLDGHIEPNEINYRSIHLGDFSNFGAELSPAQVSLLGDIRAICERYGVNGSSVHPDITPYHVYKLLLERDIPVGIENMDRLKASGKNVQDIDVLVASTGAPGVIDLQHLYEVALDNGDSLEELASGFAKALMKRGGITHLHVSGEVMEGGRQTLNHAQLTIATNQEAILKALDAVFSTTSQTLPIILEGDPLPEHRFLAPGQTLTPAGIKRYSKQAVRSISREIELVQNFLSH